MCEQQYYVVVFCGNPVGDVRHDVIAKSESLRFFFFMAHVRTSRDIRFEMYVKECDLFPNGSVIDEMFMEIVCLSVCMSRVTHRRGTRMCLVQAPVHETNVQRNLNINSRAL